MNLLMMVLFIFCTQSLLGDTLSVSGSPSAMTVSTATAGQQPNNATNATTTYNITTLNFVRSITGNINTAMPSGVTLQVQLAAPSGATSAGSVAMTTTATNLVNSIPKFSNVSNLTITYTLSATVAAALVSNATKTLTLTIQ